MFLHKSAGVDLSLLGVHIKPLFGCGGSGRYTNKPYTLEKSGIAVKEELEK